MLDNSIQLSICIPTFNRSRYLNVLLKDLSENLQHFPFQYEIIISSNASTDATDEVVHNWSNKLPIVYIKQEKNIGALASLNTAYAHARGIFSMYLADDDFIEIRGLIEALKRLIDQPKAVALYAPWKLVTLKNKPAGYPFFNLPSNIIFKKGDQLGLLQFILTYHVFPEIFIFRTSAYKQVSPITNDLTYWAFTIVSDLLSFGDIIFMKTPFYLSTTHYFDDEVRTQAGHEEVEYAWDRYRGGLEYMSSNLSENIDEKKLEALQKGISEFVVERMLVGLRLRLAKKRNPIDNYFLARRLCGLGKKASLPVDYMKIRSTAALWYLGNDAAFQNKEAIVVVGGFPEDVPKLLKSQNTLPVMRLPNYKKGLQNSVFMFKQLDSDFQGDMDVELSLGNIFLTEEILMRKFL